MKSFNSVLYGILTFFPDGFLDFGVRRIVNRTCSFIENNNGALSKQSSRHGKQLTLTLAKIRTSRGDLSIKCDYALFIVLLSGGR